MQTSGYLAQGMQQYDPNARQDIPVPAPTLMSRVTNVLNHLENLRDRLDQTERRINAHAPESLDKLSGGVAGQAGVPTVPPLTITFDRVERAIEACRDLIAKIEVSVG